MQNILFLLVGFLCLAPTNAQHKIEKGPSGDPTTKPKLRKVANRAFQPGEVIEYRVHYGFVDAGTARIEVKENVKKIGSRQAYHIVGTGKSRGAFDWFFKVRDRYETFVDTEGIFPWVFVRRVNEGGFLINQDYSFYQHKNEVDNGKGKKFEVPHGIQDMLSAYYYARTMDMAGMNINDTLEVNTFMDDEIYPMRIKYKGRDTITVNKEKFACLKFVPAVQRGRVFTKEEDLTIWITDDENKIPILAQAKILVGSIKMELTHYEGLANPISKID